MAVLKCKMCGGNLEISEGISVCECEYCGARQTVPSADSEKKLALFTRANRLRAACEFDKAFGIYESIVAEFPEEAEAYWGLILCKYGIEYVDDPLTAKKIPTCHRSSFESVLEDSDFDLVMENADPISRAVYREEAKQIEELRIRINEVSSKEEPYDIFICYKETDQDGQRTLDSVLAQDVYDALTARGYKVFFSRITLEDKLGQEYEPYIFAALNSARIMLAFGTDYEYYHAVWVKNEWSRFLHLIAKGEQKTLIPCYKDIDAYDLPAEFKRLQAQDMGKLGATQDLLRGIEKILGGASVTAPAATGGLTKRGYLYLEDKDYSTAVNYFEKALDDNPEDGAAYLGVVLAKARLQSVDGLEQTPLALETDPYFTKAIRFSVGAQQTQLQTILTANKAVVAQNHALADTVVNGALAARLDAAPRLLPLLDTLNDSNCSTALGFGKSDVHAGLLPYDITQALKESGQPMSLSALKASNARIGAADNALLKQALIDLNRGGYVTAEDQQLVWCVPMSEAQSQATLTDLQAQLEKAIQADTAEAERRRQAILDEKQVRITRLREEMLRLTEQPQLQDRLTAVKMELRQVATEANNLATWRLPVPESERVQQLRARIESLKHAGNAAHSSARIDPDAIEALFYSAASPASPADTEQYLRAHFAGRKLEAIKYYREQTGVSLREAKDYIDRIL